MVMSTTISKNRSRTETVIMGVKRHAEINVGIESKRKRARTLVQRGHIFHMYMVNV